MSRIFWVRLLLLFLFLSNGEAQNKPSFRIVSGAYFQKVQKILIYESSIPILFKVRLPQISDHFSDFSNCTADVFLCGLHNYTLYMAQKLKSNVFDSNPYVIKEAASNSSDGGSLNRRGLFDFMGEAYHFLFGVATDRQVRNLHAQNAELGNYVASVKGALAKEHKELVQVTEQLASYNVAMRKYMLNNAEVRAKAFKALQKHEIISEHVLASMIHNLALVLYETEMATSMTLSANDCKQKLWPKRLVPENVLLPKLRILKIELQKFGWEMAATTQDLQVMPFFGCTFSSVDVLVSLNIPIKRSASNLELFELVKVPFQFHSTVCTLGHGLPTYVFKDGSRIIPIEASLEKDCNVLNGHCRIPTSLSDNSARSKCAKAILEEATIDQISNECVFKCEISNDIEVREINPGLVIVTNAVGFNTTCQDGTFKSYFTNSTVGAAAIRIKCGCELHLKTMKGDVVVVPSPFPCFVHNQDNIMNITSIIPSSWSKLKSVYVSDTPTAFSDLTEILAEDWNTNIPTLNVTKPGSLDLEKIELSHKFYQYEDTSSFITIWLIILTIILVFLVLKVIFDINNARQGGLVANPLSIAAAAIPLLPGSRALTPTDLGSFMWEHLKKIEIGAVFVLILWLIIAVVTVILILKILVAIRRIAIIIGSVASDLTEQELKSYNRVSNH